MFFSYRIRSYAGNFRRRKDQSGKVPVLRFTIQKQRSETRAVGSYLSNSENLCMSTTGKYDSLSQAVSGTRNTRQCWKWHAVGIYMSPLTPTARQITHWVSFFGPWHPHSILYEGSPWPRAGNIALWHSENSGQSDTGPASRGLWCRKMYCFKRLLYPRWCTLQVARTVKWAPQHRSATSSRQDATLNSRALSLWQTSCLNFPSDGIR